MKFDVHVRVEVDEWPDETEHGREKAKEFIQELLDKDEIPLNLIEDYEVLDTPAVIGAERIDGDTE